MSELQQQMEHEATWFSALDAAKASMRDYQAEISELRVENTTLTTRLAQLEAELESETKWAKQYHDQWLEGESQLTLARAALTRIAKNLPSKEHRQTLLDSFSDAETRRQKLLYWNLMQIAADALAAPTQGTEETQ